MRSISPSSIGFGTCGSGGFKCCCWPNSQRTLAALSARGIGQGTRPKLRRTSWLPGTPLYATFSSVTRAKPEVTDMDDNLPELGDLERDVMQLVWAHAPITAEIVREKLTRQLKESTVRTVLRRLE